MTDLLLGVGQDADERGRTKGTQLSLFDVSDPADPRRIDQVTLADGTSEVEYDHHAFLHWPATGLTVVPFQRWFWGEPGGSDRRGRAPGRSRWSPTVTAAGRGATTHRTSWS